MYYYNITVFLFFYLAINTVTGGIHCPEDEVPVNCATPCGPTCTQTNPTSCNRTCKFRCDCDADLVRNERSGVCIDKDLCHSGECEEDKEYIAGGCLRTCRNPNPDFCASAHLSGCFCKDGLLLVEKSNKCVKPQNCPK